jgi:hypothetical protein
VRTSLQSRTIQSFAERWRGIASSMCGPTCMTFRAYGPNEPSRYVLIPLQQWCLRLSMLPCTTRVCCMTRSIRSPCRRRPPQRGCPIHQADRPRRAIAGQGQQCRLRRHFTARARLPGDPHSSLTSLPSAWTVITCPTTSTSDDARAVSDVGAIDTACFPHVFPTNTRRHENSEKLKSDAEKIFSLFGSLP